MSFLVLIEENVGPFLTKKHTETRPILREGSQLSAEVRSVGENLRESHTTTGCPVAAFSPNWLHNRSVPQ